MLLISRMLKILKALSYTLVAFFVWTNFLGPEGMAELRGLEVSEDNPGIEMGALLLSSQLIQWTIVAAVLEVIDNAVEFITAK